MRAAAGQLTRGLGLPIPALFALLMIHLCLEGPRTSKGWILDSAFLSWMTFFQMAALCCVSYKRCLIYDASNVINGNLQSLQGPPALALS